MLSFNICHCDNYAVEFHPFWVSLENPVQITGSWNPSHGNHSLTMDSWQKDQPTSSFVQVAQLEDMAFNGTWQVYSEENLEDFLKAVGEDGSSLTNRCDYLTWPMTWSILYWCHSGAPEMVVKMRKNVKPVIVIEQKGKEFTYTIKTPACTKAHSFSIGQETEMMTLDGRKFKVGQNWCRAAAVTHRVFCASAGTSTTKLWQMIYC